MAIPYAPHPQYRIPQSPGGLSTRFPDVQDAEMQQNARHENTPQRQLVDSLMRMIRYVSLTAAPPAHIRPTVWSDPVDLSGQTSLAAAVVPYTTVVSFTVPQGRGARIEQYGVNVVGGTYAYDGTLLWRFLKNGRVLDLGMSDWGEQRGSMVFPRKTVVNLDQNDLFQFQVKRTAVNGLGALVVQMGFRGWIWRKRNNFNGTQSSVTAY